MSHGHVQSYTLTVEGTEASVTYFYCCKAYPSESMARSAWERTERKFRAQPKGDVGVWRFKRDDTTSSFTSAGTLAPHGILVMGASERDVHRAERLLRDGSDWTSQADPGFIRALAMRRVRLALDELRKGNRGHARVTHRRPEGQGAHLFPDGSLEPVKRPQG